MKQGWNKEPLGKVCQIELGKTPYRGEKKYWDTRRTTNNVWLSIADLLNTNGKYVSDSKEYLSKEGANVSKVVKQGTLLLSFKLTLGRLAFAGKDLYTNEAIAALSIINNKEIVKEYLYYFLLNVDWNAATEGDVKVKGKTLNKAKLTDIPIEFPKTLPEQERIVAILDEAFAAIDKAKTNAEKNLKSARELFEAYLHNVFANPGEGWEEKELGDITNLITDGKHGDCINENNSGYYFLSAKDVNNGTLIYEKARQITKNDFEETHRRTDLRPGDVLLTNAGTIGRIALAPLDERTYKTTFQKSVAVIKPKVEIIQSLFLIYQLQAGANKLVSASAGSAQKNLLLRDLRNFKILVPQLSIQSIIVKELDTLFEQSKKLEDISQQKISKLDELRKSILQKAFTGEL